MKSPLFWAIIAVVATWQIEMAVNAGIAASRRPVPGKGVTPTNKASSPTCAPGTPCPPSQQSPQPAAQKIIIR